MSLRPLTLSNNPNSASDLPKHFTGTQQQHSVPSKERTNPPKDSHALPDFRQMVPWMNRSHLRGVDGIMEFSMVEPPRLNGVTVGTLNIGGINDNPLEFYSSDPSWKVLFTKVQKLLSESIEEGMLELPADIKWGAWIDEQNKNPTFATYNARLPSRPSPLVNKDWKLFKTISVNEFVRAWQSWWTNPDGPLLNCKDRFEKKFTEQKQKPPENYQMDLFGYDLLLFSAIQKLNECEIEYLENLPWTNLNAPQKLKQCLESKLPDILCVQEMQNICPMPDKYKQPFCHYDNGCAIFVKNTGWKELTVKVEGDFKYHAIQNGKLVVISFHAKSKDGKQNTEDFFKALNACPDLTEQNIIVGMDSNCTGFVHPDLPPGWSITTSMKATVCKKRTKFQVQARKAEQLDYSCKDYVAVRGVQVNETHCWPSIDAEDQYLPKSEWPTDHCMVCGTISFAPMRPPQ